MTKRLSKISKFFLAVVLIFAWLFSGWPPIWQNPHFPPEIQEAKATGETRTKTVEWFVGMNTTSGTGLAANTVWTPANFTVNLPDAISSPTMIKSAWIDFTFQTAVTTAPGVVTLTLTPSGGSTATFTSVSYLASGENYAIRVKPNFTAAVQAAQQAAGTKTYAFTAKVAGAATKMLSAKMYITYDYDSAAATQLNTIRYKIGNTTGNTAVGTTGVTFTSPTLTVAENSPTVVSAWAEIRGQVPATGTTDETFAVNYDSDSATNYYLDNIGSTDGQAIYILHNKNSITLNSAHTLKVAATAGYQMNLVSAEQVITYTFDYANSTTLTNTLDKTLGSDGLKASAVALDVTTTVNLPEDSIAFKNIFLRGTAHAAVSTTIGLAIQKGASVPTPTTSYSFTGATEALNNFWVLSDDTNDLNTMMQGDNQVSARFSGTMTSRAMQLVVTYTFAKSSASVKGSATFWFEQQTVYGTTDTPSATITIDGTTDSNSYYSYIWANSVNGVTVDRVANISTQPTSASTYNWNSTGEYQWVLFFHVNQAAEITDSGTYTLNMGSTGDNVMAAVVAVTWNYIAPTTAPTVFTREETNVADITATVNGEITVTGGQNATEHGFASSTDPMLITGVSTSTLGSFVGTGTFNENLAGLDPETTYYFRAYATNSGGTGYGDILSLTTTAAAVVSINLDPKTFAYGKVPNNTASSTLNLWAGAGIIATNGTAPADFYIYGNNTANWTLATATSTSNIYAHRFCNKTDNVCTTPWTNYTPMTTSPTTLLKSGVLAGATVAFQLQMHTPYTSTIFTEQEAIVTVQASAP
ncbi:MAG: hypothetical protein V1801_02160 [Candidatus Falkowbacteria bacterium]